MMEFELFGLTTGQLLTLAGLGVVLLVALLVLRAAFRLAKAVLRFGCAAILILLVVAFFVLRSLS